MPSSSQKTRIQKSSRELKKNPAEPRTEGDEISPIEPQQEHIAKRAYFIGERRREAGLPGDAFQDWLQAHKELVEEAKLAVTAAAATSSYLEQQNANGKYNYLGVLLVLASFVQPSSNDASQNPQWDGCR